MGFFDLFIASTIPVLKVLLVTLVGSFLALDRVGILGEDAKKHVNNVVFYVFHPPLRASYLARTITFDSLVKMWFLPFNILISYVVGSLLGWIVILVTRTPSHLHSLVVVICAAGNLGTMFLIMIPAICKETGSPFGSPDVCQTIGLAYVTLSLAIGTICQWSYVYNLLRASAKKSIKQSDNTSESSTETSTSTIESCREPLLPSKGLSESDNNADEMGFYGKWKQKIKAALGNMKVLFAPPMIGALVGFFIGLIPPIRKLFIGNDAPLRVVQDSAILIGEAAIPTVNLIVGANLLKGSRGSGVPKSVIFGIIVARYIALPLIGILVVKGAAHFGFIPSDPLYQFILHLQFAAPPAMNIGTITQLFGVGRSECSVIMLWTYSLASISLTLWSTFFLWLVA